MALFGRKEEKTAKLGESLEEMKKAVEEDKSTLPKPEETQESPISRLLEEKPSEVKPKPEPIEAERPSFAPLFVKIDRYRQILNAIGYLKTTMIMIKNSLITLSELDKARDETFKLIQDAMGKLEDKLSSLDQELIRPSGFQDRTITHTDTSEHLPENPEYQDVETVQATIADLKGQIEQLKFELDTVA